MKAFCVLLGFLLVTPHASGQALTTSTHDVPPPIQTSTISLAADVPSAPLFRGGIDLVALSVVVTDTQERFVSGLTASDFAVYEDGVQQDVSFFAATSVPLDLALLLDTSASMMDKMETMQQAALGFLRTTRPGDRASVFEIKDNVQIACPLSEDIDAANDAIRRTTARGGTALYNGLYLGIKEMVKQRKGNGEVRRQAIAVFSDGDDTASLVGYDDVMELAKQAGITIYTITLKSQATVKQTASAGRRYFSQSEFAMKSLAQETGARAFFPTQIRELGAVYGMIAEDLASQYAIGYSPKNPRRDGAFRRVIVRVSERPGARARTRAGYVAARLMPHQTP